jgi:phosphatidylinositol-3-phosphatase
MRIRLPSAVLLAGASALLGLAIGISVPVLASGRSATPEAASTGVHAPFPHMDHVFVIVMENSSYPDLLAKSNKNTAYIQELAADYGLATKYYGVTHTSLPNYVAATSGSTWGSNTDDEAQADNGYFNHLSLFDELQRAHLSWGGFMQSMPSVGYTGDYGSCTNGTTPDPDCTAGSDTGTALYVRKHNPPMQYPDIFKNPTMADHVVPLYKLSGELTSGRVPDYVWITPNICDDMHGGAPQCPYPNTNSQTDPSQERLYQDGDNFIKKWVPAIMQSKAWTGNSAIFITWDESDYSNISPYEPLDNAGCCDSPVIPATPPDPSTGSGGDLYGGTLYAGGHIPMIVISKRGARGGRDFTPMNHYSLLRTIEQNWDLPYIGYASDTIQVRSLAPLLRGH